MSSNDYLCTGTTAVRVDFHFVSNLNPQWSGIEIT